MADYVAPTIGTQGLTIPAYQDILDYLIAQKKVIYGNDIYLGEDSTDYQELSTFALMVFDVLQTAQLVYNNRGPVGAIAAALDSIVKLNGIKKQVATNSTVDLTITGTVGTIITSGIVKDISGNKWDLPATVTIPVGGVITVTATAEDAGEITATAGTVTTILTPVSGWISVTNASSATPGTAVETDAELRARQVVSTAIPSLSVLEGIAGALLNLTGVDALKYYENKTNITDVNGVPPHCVSFVIDGGDSTDIAEIIAQKITPGTGFYGTTSVTVYDEYNLPVIVEFYRPTDVTIDVVVSLTALAGYTSAIGELIKEAVADYINGLVIGEDVLWSRVLGSSLLAGTESGETFNITNITLAVYGSSPYSPAAADIDIAFNERAIAETTNVSLVVS